MIDFFDDKQKTGNRALKAADNPAAAPAAIKTRFSRAESLSPLANPLAVMHLVEY